MRQLRLPFEATEERYPELDPKYKVPLEPIAMPDETLFGVLRYQLDCAPRYGDRAAFEFDTPR